MIYITLLDLPGQTEVIPRGKTLMQFLLPFSINPEPVTFVRLEQLSGTGSRGKRFEGNDVA